MIFFVFENFLYYVDIYLFFIIIIIIKIYNFVNIILYLFKNIRIVNKKNKI